MKELAKYKILTNLYILLSDFEYHYTIGYISESKSYYQAKECWKSCHQCFEKVIEIDKDIIDVEHMGLSSAYKNYLVDLLKELSNWAFDPDNKKEIDLSKFITTHFTDAGTTDTERFALQSRLMGWKAFLAARLKLPYHPTIMSTTFEGRLRVNFNKWSAHFPKEILDIIDNDYIERISNAVSIVIVADIRKSQDLMTYGPNPDFFRDKIEEFTNESRKIIKSEFGIFDKFTGDGFLCYFNELMCAEKELDVYEQAIKACERVMDFAKPFFEEWSKHIRKLPPNSCGLTIGIDSGVVKFKDLDNHLFAVGETIVWANRMSGAGTKGEIILNNIPYNKMKDLNRELYFEESQNTSKGGEQFLSYKMKIKKKRKWFK